MGDENMESGDEGFFCDADDIIVESYEHEVTDEPSDPVRRHGSVHNGAAYNDHAYYPPWGASSGQEGGSMTPFQEKLEVPAASYDYGADVLGAHAPIVTRVGAVPTVALHAGRPGALAAGARPGKPATVAVKPRASFVLRKTPAGNTHTSLVVHKAGAHAPEKSIKNARDVAKRAISVGKKVRAAAAKMKAKPTKVRGFDILGALARAVTKRLVSGKKPRVLLTPSQLKRVAEDAIAAGERLKKAADKHEHLVNANVAHKKSMKSPKVMLRGDDVDAHGDACVVLGAHLDVLGDSLPDPTNPGYLQDGTPDPNADATDAMNVGPPPPGTADGGGAYPGPPDYGFGAPPTVAPPLQPGVDFAPDPGPDTDQTAYSSDPSKAPGAPLPEGAVINDWSRGTPNWATGSHSHFYGNANGVALNTTGWDAGGVHHDPGHVVFYDNGHRMDTVEPDQANTGAGPYVPQLQALSLRYGWGPLVGNPMTSPGSSMPAHSWTYGLRYDAGGDRWFWFRDMAPPWATAADDQQRLNQAILDYKANVTAAAADAAARAAADQLAQQQAADLTKQQAAEDAQAQRQMDQESAQAQHEAELQAKADEEAAHQQELADEAAQRQAEGQSQLQIEQAQAQAEIDRQAEVQAAQLDVEAAQAEAQLAAMQPPPDEGADHGGGEDVYDDGGATYSQDEAAATDEGENLDVLRTALDEGSDAALEGDGSWSRRGSASERLYRRRHENSTFR